MACRPEEGAAPHLEIDEAGSRRPGGAPEHRGDRHHGGAHGVWTADVDGPSTIVTARTTNRPARATTGAAGATPREDTTRNGVQGAEKVEQPQTRRESQADDNADVPRQEGVHLDGSQGQWGEALAHG